MLENDSVKVSIINHSGGACFYCIQGTKKELGKSLTRKKASSANYLMIEPDILVLYHIQQKTARERQIKRPPNRSMRYKSLKQQRITILYRIFWYYATVYIAL